MKHAYLLIIHENSNVLKRLLESIDNKNNDIYIHVDKKSRNFPFENVKEYVKISKIIFIPRIKIYWGGYSQVKAELELLKSAVKNSNYDYYHLLSGADMILKSQSYINDFFINNNGKEFINFDIGEFKDHFRINYFFIEKIVGIRCNSFGLKNLHSLFLKIQRVLLIKRNKNKKYYKGSNWFSISNNFARYVISKEKEIEKEYKYTFCADEIFLQTLIKNSEYAKNIYKNHEKIF